jgi:hypothetical protein
MVEAVLLDYFIKESLVLKGDWIRCTIEELTTHTMVVNSVITMSKKLHSIIDKGFINVRKSTCLNKPSAYRPDLINISKALCNKGYSLSVIKEYREAI